MNRRLLLALMLAMLLAMLLAISLALWQPWHTDDPLPGFPASMLFADDRAEDLRFLNPKKTGVAYVARTVVLGATGISVRPRLAALQYPAGTALMAVVRIESAGETLPPRANVIPALLPAAAGATALQVDFDVSDGERYWYYALLSDLKKELPPGKPLTIAARPSWCGAGGWIEGLPVAEVCPLLFRDTGPITLPLCQSSAGLWTGGRAPRVPRLYWFHPMPWTPAAYALTAGR